MEIIPAIDLLDGACVRLHQGDYDQVTRFSDDPVAQALSWQEQGATRLHLVDLDGAKRGEPVNDDAVRAITAALSIPVQLGGGVVDRLAPFGSIEIHQMQTGGSLLLPTQRLCHRVVAEACDLVVIPLMQTHTGTVEQIDGGDDLHGAEPFGPPSCSSALQYPGLKHRAREDPGDGGNPFCRQAPGGAPSIPGSCPHLVHARQEHHPGWSRAPQR